MSIVSTELRQVFRAYTKQLRGEYDRAGAGIGRESVARGFERVDISPEARALAKTLSDTVGVRPDAIEKETERDAAEEKDSKKEEKNSVSPKADHDSSRDKQVAN